MNKTTRFFFSTLVAAAAMTSAAFAEGTTVAKIGDVEYTSFSAALDAVSNGQTITLQNVSGTESGEKDFDLDGEITITGTASGYALPVVTFYDVNADGSKGIVNIKDAAILTPELDARQNATINVTNSTVADAGGNSIVKSYFNGTINISDSIVDTMQMTTMGYINMSGSKSEVTATWQTNIYGNGLVTVKDGAVFNTAALQLTGEAYNDRDNTDADRVGKPAELLIDGATLNIGTNCYSTNGADYNYNSSKGINIGTKGVDAVLNIKNSTATIKGANGEIVNIGANGTVNVENSTFIVGCRAENGAVNLVNKGTLTVTGNSKLDIGALSGTAVYVVGDTKLTDSFIGGNVYAGYGENKTAADLTLSGDFTAKGLYIGNKTEHYPEGTTHSLKIEEGSTVNLAALYVRTTTTGEITGATVNAGDLYVRGTLNVSGSEMSRTSTVGGGTGHWAVYEDDDANKTASLSLKDSTATTNYIVVGSNSNGESAANSNATMSLDNSKVELNTLYVQGAESFANNSVTLSSGSELTASKSVYVGSYATLNVADSTLAAGTLTNNGEVNVTGTSTLNIETLTGTIYAQGILKDSVIGGNVQASGNLEFVGTNQINTFSAGWYNNVITIGKEASLETASGRTTLSYGNTFNIEGTIEDAKTADKSALKASLKITAGLSLNGNGGNATMNADNAYVILGDSTSKNSGATGTFNMNFTNSVLEFTKTFKTYVPTAEGLAPEFNLSFKNSVASVASHLEFWNSNTNLSLDNSELIVGGSFANAGTVILENEAAFVVNAPIMSSHGGNTGTIKVLSGSRFELKDSNENWKNDGTIEVVNAELVLGDFTNNGSIILNDSSLTVLDKFQNNGTLTMLGDSTIDDGNSENGAGIALQAISVSTEKGAVKLSATGNILFAGVTETTDTTGLVLDSAKNQEVLIAWDINVDAQGQSVAVEMDIGEGLDGNQIKVFHEVSEGDWTEVEDCSYDAGTGKLSFTTNSFSSYAVAIPEPSMFGLLAGLGALALVGARRRRR